MIEYDDRADAKQLLLEIYDPDMIDDCFDLYCNDDGFIEDMSKPSHSAPGR